MTARSRLLREKTANFVRTETAYPLSFKCTQGVFRYLVVTYNDIFNSFNAEIPKKGARGKSIRNPSVIDDISNEIYSYAKINWVSLW